jgi:hypothetical protein
MSLYANRRSGIFLFGKLPCCEEWTEKLLVPFFFYWTDSA